MVKTYDMPPRQGSRPGQKNIRADVIILGCSLPGIVTAHKLKKRFGDTMDIVVLDLAAPASQYSKCNVVFQEDEEDLEAVLEKPNVVYMETEDIEDNVARHYITKYAKDFNIPLPEAIMEPRKITTTLHKLFEHRNGSTVFSQNYHDFKYLNFIEKFELNQYQDLLDQSMKNLFQSSKPANNSERRTLRYYDQTTMEQHICAALLFPTSREIMRTTVRLVCGANPEQVSVLFYLHQCYRTSSSRNHLDGDNARFREKLLGYFRKLLRNNLKKSIADITLSATPITEIRSYSDEQVILETNKGDDNYICNLLTMALTPDQLHTIKLEACLLSEKEYARITAMMPGLTKKFMILYEEDFWTRADFSGDILSINGPILWAMSKPKIGGSEVTIKQAGLIGYLRVKSSDSGSSRTAVIEQLVKMFGEAAARPINYRESDLPDVYIPRCGDYVALRKLTGNHESGNLEWGALDVFADGDVAAALEAGHTTYVRVMSFLRPQAQSYEDACTVNWPTVLGGNSLNIFMARINIVSGVRLLCYTAVIYIGYRLARLFKKA